MKIQAIIPSAGSGLRLKNALLKPLVLLEGKSILAYSLEVFEKCSLIDSVIIVGHPDKVESFKVMISDHGFKKIKCVIPGGKERCDSVKKGLQKLDEDTDIVVVHDGARPFVSIDLIERCIKEAEENLAAIAAVPVKPTIKIVDLESMTVAETLDRAKLWNVQTPQVFKKDVLLKAYENIDQKKPTDDSSLVEQMGIKVKVVQGDYQNIKITTPEDFKLAEFLVREKGKA